MRILSCTWLVLVLMALPVQQSAQSVPQSSSASFSVTLKMSQTVVHLGSEIKIEAVLTNQSNHEKWFGIDGGGLRGEFTYEIGTLDHEGHEPSKTQYFHAVRGEDSPSPDGKTQLVLTRRMTQRPVKPGDSLTEFISFNKLYDLKPGTYTVQVERADDETKTVVKSNVVTITIEP
jgi:hypothetical protein